jgi:hypothetical protein
MSDQPHDFSKGTGTAPVTGHPTWKLTCPECNWTQIVATALAPPIQQCSVCGWDEIQAIREGTFASFVCAEHGRVTCVIPNAASKPSDCTDIFCPHCRVQAGQYFKR